MRITMSVVGEADSVAEAASAELEQLARTVEGVDVEHAPPSVRGGGQARVGALEVVLAFVGSAAFIEFARAVRDYVQRTRIEVSLRDEKGRHVTVSASGGDLSSLEPISDFLKAASQRP